jgi:hypothetical protein
MKSTKLVVLLLGLALVGVPSASVYAQEQEQKQPFHAYPPEEPQGSYPQTWHDGFNSGRDAANHDVEAGVPAKPARHKEYSHPNLAPVASEDFREGFRVGYEAVYDHFIAIGWRPTPEPTPAPKN